MLNYVWSFLVLVGLVAATLLGNLKPMMDSVFATCEMVVMTIALPLAGKMMLWLGVLRVMEKAGLMELIARALSPVLRLLFPDVPRTHPAMGAITMNISANLLGLGNSATPMGLKAMEHLQELNPHKRTASNAMCMFLAINTAGLTLIPFTAITFLSNGGMKTPYGIILPTLAGHHMRRRSPRCSPRSCCKACRCSAPRRMRRTRKMMRGQRKRRSPFVSRSCVSR